MRKRRSPAALWLAALVLLCACTPQTPEPDYAFPPDAEAVAYYMEALGIDWTLGPGGDPKAEPDPLSYRLENSAGSIWGSMNLTTDPKGLTYSFNYRSFCTAEECAELQHDVWLPLCRLAGRILDAPQDTAALWERCAAYFEGYDLTTCAVASKPSMLEWHGRAGDLHVIAVFAWLDRVDRYVPFLFTLGGTASIEQWHDSSVERLLTQKSPELLCSVADLPEALRRVADLPEPKDKRVSHLVKGRLEGIEANTDTLDMSQTRHAYPHNFDQYLKAQLTDATGSVTVYVAPTSLTVAELESERLYQVAAILGSQPFLLVGHSTTNFEAMLARAEVGD